MPRMHWLSLLLSHVLPKQMAFGRIPLVDPASIAGPPKVAPTQVAKAIKKDFSGTVVIAGF